MRKDLCIHCRSIRGTTGAVSGKAERSLSAAAETSSRDISEKSDTGEAGVDEDIRPVDFEPGERSLEIMHIQASLS
jgi:hypothetical protein